MLLKAPGAKLSAAARDLVPLLPRSFSEYREPMAFGAGLYWHIPAHVKRWIGDINPVVVDFYKWFRDNPDSVDYILGLKEELASARDIYRHFLWSRYDYAANNNPLAFWYLTQYAWFRLVHKSRRNICSFDPRNISHGGIRRFNRDMLDNCKRLLADTKITLGDFESVVNAPGVNVVVFLDPPYRNASIVHKAYDFTFTDSDWIRLERSIRESPHKILMTVGEEDQMHDLFDRPPYHCHVREYYGWFRSAGLGMGGIHRDLVVRNYK